MRETGSQLRRMALNVFGRRSVGYYNFSKMLMRFLLRKIALGEVRPRNILIVGLGRSGTTWISNLITDYYQGENFGEILQFRPPMVAKYLSLSSSATLRAVSVFKILTYQLEENGIDVSQLSSWYNEDIEVIVAVRRDALEQIASVIYSRKVGLWHRTAGMNMAPSITVSKREFDEQFHWSCSQQKVLDGILHRAVCPVREIAYEDFDDAVLPSVLGHAFAYARTEPGEGGINKRDVKKLSRSGVADRIENWSELQLWYEANH